MPLNPILFLEMSTYSQFVFGTDTIRQPVSFPRAEISKAPTMDETTKGNPSDAQEKAEEDVRRAHGEKTQHFSASPSDRHQASANKSDAAKRQDAQKGVRGGRLPRAPGCGEETCRECASRCSPTQRNRERRAWPNLACLMKNGQESAYLAHPSLSSTAASPHFLLPSTSAPLLPLLHPSYLPPGSRLYPLFDLLHPFNQPSPQK